MYHRQTNGQTAKYNRSIVALMRHDVNELHTDWDDYVKPLTYGYSLQVHRKTANTTFSLMFNKEPAGSVDYAPSSAVGEPNRQHVRQKPTVLDRLRLMTAKADLKANLFTFASKRFLNTA